MTLARASQNADERTGPFGRRERGSEGTLFVGAPHRKRQELRDVRLRYRRALEIGAIQQGVGDPFDMASYFGPGARPVGSAKYGFAEGLNGLQVSQAVDLPVALRHDDGRHGGGLRLHVSSGNV